MIKLKKITIAPVKIKRMVQFYNGVFESKLEPFEALGTFLYRGRIADKELLLCPNEILGIVAEKNRQQFSFEVDDIEEIVNRVNHFGGELLGEIQTTSQGKVCGIKDPDGNTIEFIEVSKISKHIQ